MIRPKAPRWFVKGLEDVDPSLRVVWIGPGRWAIYQVDKALKDMGTWNGMHIFKPVEKFRMIHEYSSLGSRIFHDIRRFDTKNIPVYEEFCKEHNIRME